MIRRFQDLTGFPAADEPARHRPRSGRHVRRAGGATMKAIRSRALIVAPLLAYCRGSAAGRQGSLFPGRRKRQPLAENPVIRAICGSLRQAAGNRGSRCRISVTGAVACRDSQHIKR